MPTFTASLSKAQVTNPIPKILELVPYTESVIDALMLDSMAAVMIHCGYTHISNSMVMLLLIDLQKAGLIKLQEVSFASVLGTVIIAQRNIDGKQES